MLVGQLHINNTLLQQTSKTYINPFFFQQNLNTMNFKTLEKSFPTTTLDYSEFPELQELFPTALGDNELPDF